LPSKQWIRVQFSADACFFLFFSRSRQTHNQHMVSSKSNNRFWIIAAQWLEAISTQQRDIWLRSTYDQPGIRGTGAIQACCLGIGD
jgi:hypothetical protein